MFAVVLGIVMHKIRTPYSGIFFVYLLLLTTSITSMESELKQRLLTNNSNDTKISIEQLILGQSTIEDCSICYEEKEVIFVPCTEGEKHPKICSVCLDGCEELCPFCRRKLMIEKKRSDFIENIYQGYNDSLSYSNRLCVGASCGCLTIYIYLMFGILA